MDTTTLLDATNIYLTMRQINKKKYLASYLVNARFVWRHLYKNTIYAVQSEWLPMKRGEPYNYVELPRDTVRFFSASVVDACGNIEPLYYNERLNVLRKPTKKKCGCGGCDCGGTCEDVNSMVYTTRLLFSINNVDYYEKKWVKICPNGDMIEYTEVPTKKYNTFTGDGGDYNNDYNNDYSIGSAPFSDYTIVTEVFQKKICVLDVHPCGCPMDTEHNHSQVEDLCGCYLNCFGNRRKAHCDRFLPDINPNCKGEVKVSECGNKLYYKPQRIHHDSFRHVDGNKSNIPDYLLINRQTSGENCTDMVQVPEYSLEALWAGIDHYTKRFNNSFSKTEKDDAKYNFRDEENKLIMFLNPISLETMAQVADAPVIW